MMIFWSAETSQRGAFDPVQSGLDVSDPVQNRLDVRGFVQSRMDAGTHEWSNWIVLVHDILVGGFKYNRRCIYAANST